MSRPDPRDRAIETMLRAAAEPGAPSDDCLDAETLAAWADQGLEAAALERVEAHVADCARCQAAMAALVSAAPEALPAARGGALPARGWRWFDIRWLMPIAGAATAVLLWTVVPDEAPRPQARPVPDARAAGAARVGETPTEEAARQAAPVDIAPPAPTATARERRAEAPGRPAAIAGKEESAVPAPQEAAATASSSAPPAAPAAVPPARALEGRAEELAGGGARQNLARESRAAGAIVSRDPAARWRFAAPSALERSTDGGASWSRVESDLTASLLSGSAPSPTVCWVVGAGGIVGLTTDARTLRRVESPTSDDLVAVDAESDREATVRTATGRAFRTVDGGTTWMIVP